MGVAVGWAKALRAVPTKPCLISEMVGTLRFAHPTGSRSGMTNSYTCWPPLMWISAPFTYDDVSVHST
jgi:hypothetical protein